MNLSRWPISYQPMRDAGYIEFLSPILKFETNRSLYCMIVLCFLIGKEENSAAANYIRSNSANIESVIDALSNTVNRIGGNGYGYGIFSFQIITKAILTLSISDANKLILSRQKVTIPLVKVLTDFLSEDEGDINGGGNQDIISAEYAVETLLQLSFTFESDEDLRAGDLFPRHDGSLEYFTSLLTQLSSSQSRFSDPSRIITSNLLSRLVNSPSTSPRSHSNTNITTLHSTTTAANVNPSHSSHVMISYCWGNRSKPENVKALTNCLRQMQYDVWRDEEGSRLMEAMSGATEACMAQAIELSSTVILCVSREYKESANCRLEAIYAQQLAKKEKLSLIFAMMDREYTTASKPDYLDGWLAFIVGDALWYPLWDGSTSGVESTAQRIAKQIGDKSKISPSHVPTSVLMNTASEQRFNSTTGFTCDSDMGNIIETETDGGRKYTTTSNSNLARSTSVTVVRNSSPPPRNAGRLLESNSTQSLPSSGSKYSHEIELWILLSSLKNQKIIGKVFEILDELGIYDPEALLKCEEDEYLRLADCLKKVPRAIFLSRVFS
eukprot:gene13018-27470_t